MTVGARPGSAWRRPSIASQISVADQCWRDRAQCLDADPELFYPFAGGASNKSTREKAFQPAKMYCVGCPVVTDCLIDALNMEKRGLYARYGVRGGLSPEERATLVKTRAAARAATL